MRLFKISIDNKHESKNDFHDKYKQESLQYVSIVERFGELQEIDLTGAYNLMVESLQAYNRWSRIKLDIKQSLARGEKTPLKERLEEICKYLKEVHTTSRMIWSRAKEDFISNREV